ncbi:MAG: hypothetical protein ACHQO8_05475 [Vicinamibacterales bacterium]
MVFGSIDSVVAAVQEDARAEIEKIDRELSAAVARAREEDAQVPVIVADADARVGAARRQAHDRTVAQDWADRQAAIRDREAWMATVTAEGERRLRALDAATARCDLIRLAREALERMPNQPIELLVAPAEIGLLDPAARDELAAASGRPVARVTPAPDVSGGCIAQTLDGHIRYDNTYQARSRRFDAVWRARLGDVYEQRD